MTRDRARTFHDLVASHRTRLYRFILANIGHAHDAEDLVQQTFVEAYRSLATFRGESEMSTWLFGIALNLVRNYLARAPHRKHKFVGAESLEHTPSDSVDPAETASQVERLRFLNEAIGTLPKELQVILMLIAVDGISYDEAANLLSVPIGTVRSRLSRARQALRDRLTDVMPEFVAAAEPKPEHETPKKRARRAVVPVVVPCPEHETQNTSRRRPS